MSFSLLVLTQWKTGNSNNVIIIIDDPCDDPYPNPITLLDYDEKDIEKQTPIIKDFKIKPSINIFNSFGKLVHSGNLKTKRFDVNNLKKGFYIVKYQTAKGKILTKKLMVD